MLKSRSPAKVCSRIGLALFLMLFVWVFGANTLSALIAAHAPALLQNGWSVWLANDIPLYLIGMPIFLLVLQTIPNGPQTPRYKVPIGPGRYIVLFIFSLGIAQVLAVLVAGIVYALQQLLGSGGTFGNGDLAELAAMDNPFANLVFGACVPALGEEFLFRYMLRRKMAGCADRTYICTSGLCFAAFHVNVSQMVYAFVLGAFFAWLYLATRNIWLPVSLHFLINFFSLVLVPLAQRSILPTLLLGLFILAVMPTAVVLFFVYRKRVMATWLPPTEPGWPRKPPLVMPQSPWQPARWPAQPYPPYYYTPTQPFWQPYSHNFPIVPGYIYPYANAGPSDVSSLSLPSVDISWTPGPPLGSTIPAQPTIPALPATPMATSGVYPPFTGYLTGRALPPQPQPQPVFAVPSNPPGRPFANPGMVLYLALAGFVTLLMFIIPLLA